MIGTLAGDRMRRSPVEVSDEHLAPSVLRRCERHHLSIRRDRRKLLETDEVRHGPNAVRRRGRRGGELRGDDGTDCRRSCKSHDTTPQEERSSPAPPASVRFDDSRLLQPRFEIED
jgi:hypothetical protein